MSSEKPFAMDGNATDTADNATNAADNATDAASPQRQLHATEQNSTSAEPELTDRSSFPNVQTSGFCSYWQKALFVDITRSPLKSFRTPLKLIESSLQRGAIVGCIIYRTYLTFIIRTLATHVGESPLTFAGVLYSIGLSSNCHVGNVLCSISLRSVRSSGMSNSCVEEVKDQVVHANVRSVSLRFLLLQRLGIAVEPGWRRGGIVAEAHFDSKRSDP